MEYFNYYLDVWKKYVVFSGRARRKEYWFFVLFHVIIYFGLGIISGVIKTDFLTGLYGLATLLPGLAVTVRRLHDTDRSGWWILIGLIPLVGTIILVVFSAQDSKPGSNQYGPNPKEGMGSSMTPPSAPTPAAPSQM